MIKIFLYAALIACCNSAFKNPAATKKYKSQQTKNGTSSKTNNRLPVKTFHLVAHAIHLKKGIDFKLNIPEGYNINIATEGMKRLRFLAKSPDGRLFATDMFNLEDNAKGKILIFENWNNGLKQFEKVTVYLAGLHNPNQVAFYKDYLYVAETDKLTRYKYNSGDEKPSSSPELIATFPANGLSYKYGGWHLTRSMAFYNNKLYVSVGSSCNACVEKEEVRATIIEMDPDGTNTQYFAKGLRNSVAIKWVDDKLWATSMGRDLIGADKPEDLFLQVQRNGYYGWPFYFQYKNKIYADEQFKDSVRASWVKKSPVAYCGFKAHSAPLGFEYMKNFADTDITNSFLVCLHGSTTVSRQRGNAIVQITSANNYITVIDGFLTGKAAKDRHGRPCDILMNDTRSFFFTDDLNGVLYYVWK